MTLTVTETVFLLALCVSVAAYALGSVALRLARANLDNPAAAGWLREATGWAAIQGLALLVFLVSGALMLAQWWGFLPWI